MPNVFRDRIIDFQQFDIDPNEDVFEQILDIRKNDLDPNRFFLRYISPEDLAKYDFNNLESLNEFRDICCTCMKPLKGMAGLNYRPEVLEEGIRYGGIRISDPFKKIEGQFTVRDNSIYYSPFWGHFFEERDLIKFANDIYFTTIPFDSIAMKQIELAEKHYVHTRFSRNLKEMMEHGEYIMEEVSKEQMVQYLTDPEQGKEVLRSFYK